MSNYGLKRYSPEQIKEQWRESTARQIKVPIDQIASLEKRVRLNSSLQRHCRFLTTLTVHWAAKVLKWWESKLMDEAISSSL